MIVEAWLQRAAASASTAIAVDAPAGRCSYAELLARAQAGADALAGRGARRGERVAIALPAGLDFVYALHACLLLGAVAVPLDLRLGERERAAIVDGAAVVIDEPLDTEGGRGANRGVSTGAVHDLDSLAAIIHTSGTTLAPKPVELTYGNFLWSALGSAVALGVDPGERWLCNLPLSHVGGLSILVRSAIYATTAVVHERFDAELTLRALTTDLPQVTIVSLVATTLARLLDAGLECPPALRCALTGGGPVPAALLERARAAGVPVSLTYGLTEACSQVSTLSLSSLSDERCAAPTAGPPLFCTRLRTAPDGEIEVAGPTVARGAAGAEGWLRTGDLGKLNAEGNLYVTGRKADTIVSGGENVAPSEVEAVLEGCPGVLEAAVLGRADPRWGEAVTALVVLRAGADLGEDALRAHCAARLAPYKVPKRVALVEGPLPRTPSGKLLRRGTLAVGARVSADAHKRQNGERGPRAEAMHPAEEHRIASAEHWEDAAPGWVRRQRTIREFGAPVSQWMLHAIDPSPGQRVLELAAGLGETGLLAAELVAPTGGVILSDHAEGMLDGARERAAELELTNVEFQVWNAEWIDLPVASVDAVLCRWGYMLMADPGAALSETRRVLRPGGSVALAVWDAVGANPWALLPRLELIERGLAPVPAPPPADGRVEHTPGPFALGDPGRVRCLLERAGFAEPRVEAIDVAQRHESFDTFWETMLDISRELHDLVLAQPAQEIEQIRASLAVRLEPYTAADGTLAIPGRALVAAASA